MKNVFSAVTFYCVIISNLISQIDDQYTTKYHYPRKMALFNYSEKRRKKIIKASFARLHISRVSFDDAYITQNVYFNVYCLFCPLRESLLNSFLHPSPCPLPRNGKTFFLYSFFSFYTRTRLPTSARCVSSKQIYTQVSIFCVFSVICLFFCLGFLYFLRFNLEETALNERENAIFWMFKNAIRVCPMRRCCIRYTRVRKERENVNSEIFRYNIKFQGGLQNIL